VWTAMGKQVGIAKAAKQIQDEFDKAVCQGITGHTVKTAGTQR